MCKGGLVGLARSDSVGALRAAQTKRIAHRITRRNVNGFAFVESWLQGH